jgi:hypothetical protein
VATSQKLNKNALVTVEIILFPLNLKQVVKHFTTGEVLHILLEVLSFGAALHQFSTVWKTSFLQICYPLMVSLFWDDQSPMMLHQESQQNKHTHTQSREKKSHTLCHFDNTYFHGSTRPNVVTLLKPWACCIGVHVKLWIKRLVKQKCF